MTPIHPKQDKTFDILENAFGQGMLQKLNDGLLGQFYLRIDPFKLENWLVENGYPVDAAKRSIADTVEQEFGADVLKAYHEFNLIGGNEPVNIAEYPVKKTDDITFRVANGFVLVSEVTGTVDGCFAFAHVDKRDYNLYHLPSGLFVKTVNGKGKMQKMIKQLNKIDGIDQRNVKQEIIDQVYAIVGV